MTGALNMLHGLISLAYALWEKAGIIIRVAMISMVAWPFFLLGLTFLAGPVAPAIASVLVLAIGLILIMSSFNPITIVVIEQVFDSTRRFLSYVCGILAIELLIGLYLYVVPVSNDPAAIPALFLIAAIILALTFSPGVALTPRLTLSKLLLGLLIVMFTWGTVAFFVGGLAKALQLTSNTLLHLAQLAKISVAPDEGTTLIAAIVVVGGFIIAWLFVATLQGPRSQ